MLQTRTQRLERVTQLGKAEWILRNVDPLGSVMRCPCTLGVRRRWLGEGRWRAHKNPGFTAGAMKERRRCRASSRVETAPGSQPVGCGVAGARVPRTSREHRQEEAEFRGGEMKGGFRELEAGRRPLPYSRRCRRSPPTFPRSPQYLDSCISQIPLETSLGPPRSCPGQQALMRTAGEQWRPARADPGRKPGGGRCSATRRVSASRRASPGLELDPGGASAGASESRLLDQRRPGNEALGGAGGGVRPGQGHQIGHFLIH